MSYMKLQQSGATKILLTFGLCGTAGDRGPTTNRYKCKRLSGIMKKRSVFTKEDFACWTDSLNRFLKYYPYPCGIDDLQGEQKKAYLALARIFNEIMLLFSASCDVRDTFTEAYINHIPFSGPAIDIRSEKMNSTFSLDSYKMDPVQKTQEKL